MGYTKITFFQLIIFALVLFSCRKENLTDFEERKNNIIGDWSVEHILKEFRSDSLHKETASKFEISIYDNGKGLKESFVGNESFEWVYQYNPEKIAIRIENGNVISNQTHIFDILQNYSESQLWEYEVNQVGLNANFVHTWSMIKID